jgi:hypothetical protein
VSSKRKHKKQACVVVIYFEATSTRGNEAGPPGSGSGSRLDMTTLDTWQRELDPWDWRPETGQTRDDLEDHPHGSWIACEHRRAGTIEREYWPLPAASLASQQRSSSPYCLADRQSKCPPSARPIPTDPVLPRRAPRQQVNQTKSALVMVWS